MQMQMRETEIGIMSVYDGVFRRTVGTVCDLCFGLLYLCRWDVCVVEVMFVYH